MNNVPRREDPRALVRLISCSLLAALLAGLGRVIPLLGFWGALICPLPLAVLGCRDGGRSIGWGIILTGALLTLLLSPAFAIYFLLGCAPISLALFLIAGGKWRGSEALMVCVLTSLGAKLSLAFFFRVLTGQNILLPNPGQMELVLSQFYSNLPPDQNQAVQEAVRQMIHLFPYMLPSLFLIIAGLDSIVNYKFCEYILRPRGSQDTARRLPALPPFSLWRFPKSLLWALLLSLVLGWLWDIKTWLVGAMFAVNLRLVLNVLFFVQGFSLILWWTEHRKFRPVFRFLLLFIMLVPLMWMWPVFLGVSDMAFDFRARVKKNST